MSHSEATVFTRSEREDKKYTVADAVASARRRLDKDGMKEMCTNALHSPHRRSYDDKITLEQLNAISDEIYNDSHYYYNGPKLRRPKFERLQW